MLARINWDRNFRGLGICIIGNLDKKEMTSKQYESLIELTLSLMEAYNIDIDNVGFSWQNARRIN
jgi:N-acetylmuramoyl-L-alanine amidase